MVLAGCMGVSEEGTSAAPNSRGPLSPPPISFRLAQPKPKPINTTRAALAGLSLPKQTQSRHQKSSWRVSLLCALYASRLPSCPALPSPALPPPLLPTTPSQASALLFLDRPPARHQLRADRQSGKKRNCTRIIIALAPAPSTSTASPVLALCSPCIAGPFPTDLPHVLPET